MTTTNYYLQLVDGIVSAYHSHEIDKDVLPKGEKLIKIETDNPSAYLGLDEKQIYLDPLPEVNHDTVDKDTLNYRRQELKKMFYEIQFTNKIGEDSKELEVEFETKLREYNALKNPE